MNAGRLAILAHRIGPYHRARLLALRERAEVVALEFTHVDRTYAWSPSEGLGVERRVLFPDSDVADASASEICERVWRVLDEIDPDAVVIPGWSEPACLASSSWCLRRGRPSVLVSDSTAWDAPRVFYKELPKRRVVKLHGAALVAGSPQADYVEALGMPRDRIFTACDVVDERHFWDGAERARQQTIHWRARLGLPERYFLCVSRFVAKKNLGCLLEGYARYRQLAEAPETSKGASSEPWGLVLVGDGEERVLLQAQAQRLGISPVWPGFVQYDALPAYYGLAETFVLPSLVEQWGLVVNEAMAAGLPVLVSERCGCVRDLISEGENGYTFDPRDPEAIAERLLTVSSVHTDRANLGRESRERIAHFTLQAYVDGVLRAVNAAQAAPRPRANAIDRALLWALVRR